MGGLCHLGNFLDLKGIHNTDYHAKVGRGGLPYLNHMGLWGPQFPEAKNIRQIGGPPSWSKHWGPLSREGAESMICGFKECLIPGRAARPFRQPPAPHPLLEPWPGPPAEILPAGTLSEECGMASTQ